ncbi:hypothetical protein [Streptomyces sp. V4I23]|uniref:hypothetical protein n=1 Tax=Streptomyces sp. V4I23 TaxID=3042282 RepID=UPI0027D8424A|nr:hypothetical protein [Streptomyces sp. V4I23]
MEYERPPTADVRQRYGAVEEYEPGDGCLAQVIRIPLRIVVVLLVVPVRMAWDVLAVCGRALHRTLLRPAGRALARIGSAVLRQVLIPVGKALFVWPWVALWRYVVVPVVTYGLVAPVVWLYRHVLAPLGRGIAWAVANLLVAPLVWMVANLLVAPLVWLHRHVLTPLGRGVAAVLGWLGKALFVWPWVALWRYVVVPVVTYGLVVPVVWICRYGLVLPAVWLYRNVLTPLGHGIVRLLVHLVVAPAAWVYRCVLAPIGRETVAALRLAWQFAGYVSRAVGRGLKWLAWNLAGRPARWFYRGVCTPVGHFVRDAVWRPVARAAVEAGRTVHAAFASARLTLRRARRDAWRALGGGTVYPEPATPMTGAARRARNLGDTQQPQTVPGVAAETEISLRKQG